MKITATTATLRIDYRIQGKFYNQGSLPEGTVPQNGAERSDYPFDSAEVQPGESWESNGAEVIRVVELGGNAGPADLNQQA